MLFKYPPLVTWLVNRTNKRVVDALLPKEALEKAKTDAKMLKTSFWPPSQKGRAVEAIASSQLSCIWLKSLLCKHATDMQ